MHLRIRAFRAIDDHDTCRRFIKGHVDILKNYSITNITSNKPDWIWNPSVYGVIAESPDKKKTYGGVRVHTADGINPLPVEDAVSGLDSRIHDYIAKHAETGTGEACAQWNSLEVAGMGLSPLLIRSAISIVSQLRLSSLFGICADYTLRMFQSVGYRIVYELGDNGDFVYPNSNYIARVIKMDPISLKDVEEYNRERIFDLRERPDQRRLEQGRKGEMDVDYDLIIPK